MARIRTLTAPFDPHVFLSKVGDGKTLLKPLKDQIMFSQGDAADAVFYIQEGKVKLTIVSQQGKEAVVAILEPGSFFGEACLAGEHVRVATTTAIEKSTIVRIAKQAMINLLHEEPSFSELFISYMLSRNIRIQEDLVDHLFSLIQARSDSPGFYCYWPTLAKKGNMTRSLPKLARQRSPIWLALRALV